MAAALALFASGAAAAETDFYVGTYTRLFGSKGIYRFQFDSTRGELSGGELVARASNPSFLAIHPNRRWLYAANERKHGMVNAYAIGSDGKLLLINRQSSLGSGPCHVTLDRRGRCVIVANYGSGTVAVLPVLKDGSLGAATGFDQQAGTGPNRDRQEGPHAHCVNVDESNRFLYSCDLGNDRVEGYRLNAAKGTIAPDPTATGHIAPGSGPRHLVLDPRGFAYVINELSNTITVCQHDSTTGAFRPVQTISTLPAGYAGFNTTAEIVLHPNGKFLYASNRGHDSIAIFAVAKNGRLRALDRVLTGGKTPRNFALDPSGRWLLAANQDTHDIFVFGVNRRTGQLTPTGRKVHVGMPVCIAFAPSKK